MNKLGYVLGTLVSLSSFTAFAAPTTWDIDPAHSSAAFSVRHMMVSTVRGNFGKLTGTVTIDGTDWKTAVGDASVDANTVDTREAKRDGHLKSPDFFDVGQYPELTFRSTKIEPKGKDRFSVSGDLTIRGTTNPVSFDAVIEGVAADSDGGQHLGASGTLVIERGQWGLVWNQPLANGVLVGDKVTVQLELSAIDETIARKWGLAPAAVASAA